MPSANDIPVLLTYPGAGILFYALVSVFETHALKKKGLTNRWYKKILIVFLGIVIFGMVILIRDMKRIGWL
jgi:hypothetical protein